MSVPSDPIILLSYINTQLRDNYSSLAALCEDKQADEQTICRTLAALDYHYDPARNQFV